MFDVCCDTTDMRTHRHCDDAVETAPSGEPYDWASPSSSHETSPLLDIDRQRRRASLAIVLLLAAALLPASATAAKVGCPGCGTALASRPIVATAAPVPAAGACDDHAHPAARGSRCLTHRAGPGARVGRNAHRCADGQREREADCGHHDARSPRVETGRATGLRQDLHTDGAQSRSGWHARRPDVDLL